MSKSRHAYLVPMIILISFVALLFTNCDRAKFPKQPSVYVPPAEVPQGAVQAVPELPPPSSPDPVVPPPPTTNDFPPIPN